MCFSILLLSGCDLLNQRHAEIKYINDDVTAITYPTELRGAYIFKPGNSVSFCAEPSPDIGIDAVKKLTSDLSGASNGITVNEKLSADISDKVVELAGRSELVLLARDLLYRACELNKSGNSNLGEYLYHDVVKLIITLGETDKIKQETEYLKASAAYSNNDKTSICISSWRKKDTNNTNDLNKWLENKNVSLFLFINGDKYSDLRKLAISDLKILCNS